MDLSASPTRAATFRISVTKNDRLALNSAFHAHLKNASAFRLRVSPDGYTLLLDTGGPFNPFLTDKGVQTRHDLGELLRDLLPRLLPGRVVRTVGMLDVPI